MLVVNFSITLPDEKHPATQVHISGPGVRELTAEVPMQALSEDTNQSQAGVGTKETALAAEARRAQDEYVLGGYAGI
jgi:hypothetical protein